MGFSLTIELFLTAAHLLLTTHCRLNTFFNASAAHPLNRGTTDVQGAGDVIVLLAPPACASSLMSKMRAWVCL